MGLIALLQVCLDAEAAPANPSLSFYVISKDKINDGRFIDSPEFPKLGYISDKPRLVIVRLKSVLPGTREDVLVDKEGDRTPVPKTALIIQMLPEDAKLFSELSKQVIGKRLLIMVGETPLMAPVVNSPIQTERFEISFGQKTNYDAVHEALKKLVK